MSLISCEEDCALIELARRHHVQHQHFWLPLAAALPTRAGKGTRVTVGAATPLAIVDNTTQAVSFDKCSICTRLLVAQAHLCEETTVEIDPAATPPGCTVFVRWDHRGTKRVRAGAQVLYYEAVAAEKQPSSSHSSVTAGATGGTAGLKRSRNDGDSSSITAASLADTLRGQHQRVSLQQRSTEDLQRRLSAVLQAQGCVLNARSLHILTSTAANIRQRSSQPPLHFVLSANEESVEAGGVRWARSNRRLLSRVFRGSSSEERSEASKYSDGSRQVRFYFIEDVLLHRPRLWKAAAPAVAAQETSVGDSPEATQHRQQGARADDGVAEARDAAAGSAATSSSAAAGDVDLALRGSLLADMNSYAERGFRIVFVEHYPALHHASRFTLEKTLEPVVRLCRTCCPHLTVTVVLSAMSYVTATRRQGMELSLVLPQTGLLQFFVAEMNTSLQPDAKASCVVGSGARGSDFLSALHRDFARNASLTYVDVAELR